MTTTILTQPRTIARPNAANTLPEHVSWSQIKSWLDCGMRYKLERIDQVPQTPGVWQVGGTAFHRWTEHLDKTGEPKRWLDVFDEAVADAEKDTGTKAFEWRTAGRKTKAKPDGESLTWWATEGERMADMYVDFRQSNPELVTSPDLVEADVTSRFGDTTVKAFMDRLFHMPDGEMVVVDLKTGSRTPDPSQVALYATCVELTRGVRPRYGAYYMARTGVLAKTDVTWLGRSYWQRVIDSFVTALQDSIFIPHPGPFCDSCGVNQSCNYYNPTLEGNEK